MAKIRIFRLFKRLVVLTLIIGGGWLYFNNSRIQAASTAMIWNFRQRIVNLIGHGDDSTTQNLNLSDSDSQKNQQTGQQRFPLMGAGQAIPQQFMLILAIKPLIQQPNRQFNSGIKPEHLHFVKLITVNKQKLL